jgi:SSS family solute:Na+ symporter
MSTISTHLNWGASYVVNDFLRIYVEPVASERKLVWVARLSTVIMMVLAAIVAFNLDSAGKAFNVLVGLGAGTGSVLMARWFWWRVNAWSEIVAVIAAALVATFFNFTTMGAGWSEALGSWGIVVQVAIVTVGWIIATLLTAPTDLATLKSFIELANPGGIGWNHVKREIESKGDAFNITAQPINFPVALLATLAGCFLVYGLLFANGYFLYTDYLLFGIWLTVAIILGFTVKSCWSKLVSASS